MAHSFLPADLAQLEARGISVEKAEKQLQSFATGFPELDIVSAASVGNGVLNPTEEEIDAYVKAWQDYLDERKSPPSVCLAWALPVRIVNFMSVITEPVNTPTCCFSIKWVIINLCQFLSRISSLQVVSNCIPLP